MESFVLTGKAETVFRLLKLKARLEKEKHKEKRAITPARRTA